MVHFKVESKSLGTLASTYFHDPESLVTSIQDYLEDMLENGWEFVNRSDPGDTPYWVFRAVGQPE